MRYNILSFLLNRNPVYFVYETFFNKESFKLQKTLENKYQFGLASGGCPVGQPNRCFAASEAKLSLALGKTPLCGYAQGGQQVARKPVFPRPFSPIIRSTRTDPQWLPLQFPVFLFATGEKGQTFIHRNIRKNRIFVTAGFFNA